MTETREKAEKCENCGKRPITHHDADGVPFCQRCWDDPTVWEESRKALARP